MGNKQINIISLGAGVQSSVMALMAAAGEIKPMPDAAIFADTGWEPTYVIKWVDWLSNRLPFPVYTVSAGNLGHDIVAARGNEYGTRFASVPFFVDSENGGMLRRQCTREYKIEPIERIVRRWFLGLRRGERWKGETTVSQWIGISTDEATRMKESRVKFIKNRWPLIEASMNRNDCLAWMEKRRLPKPQKSACIGCPYRDDTGWRDMKIRQPELFSEAVRVDRALRENTGRGGIKEKMFMHRSLQPLDQVDFRSLEDMGQINMFENECEGMCGV